MKFFSKSVFAALLGSFLFVAAPAAQAQVNISIGRPAWGPVAPPEAQYYYIPDIDGYYDLYSQQYIVFQDGYWVPLPELYGYDPYQFHPVVIGYRGREPWIQRDYYHSRYAYRPYQPYYGASRNNYGPGYGRGGYARSGYDRDSRERYDNRGRYGNDDHGYNNHRADSRNQYPGNQGGTYGRSDYPRGGQASPQPGQGQPNGHDYNQGRNNQSLPNGGRGESGRRQGR